MTRVSPASLSVWALAASAEPLVVSAMSVMPSIVGEHRDEPLQVAAQQRLAAGEPHLRDALVRERCGQPRDLLEREQLGAWQERVVVAEDLLRHAVGAAEVAAVGDRDPQVAKWSGTTVEPAAHVAEGA